jgi:hypothetical protein
LIDNDVNLPVKKFVKGFVFAFNGIRAMLRERNFLVELGMLLVTILLGIYFKIDRQDWINIFSVSGLVLGLEVIMQPLFHGRKCPHQNHKRHFRGCCSNRLRFCCNCWDTYLFALPFESITEKYYNP